MGIRSHHLNIQKRGPGPSWQAISLPPLSQCFPRRRRAPQPFAAAIAMAMRACGPFRSMHHAAAARAARAGVTTPADAAPAGSDCLMGSVVAAFPCSHANRFFHFVFKKGGGG